MVDKAVSMVAVEAKASPPHSFTTVVLDYIYDIEIDPETLAVSKADFQFQFSDLDSEKPKRDKKMLKWMDVEANPMAGFELQEVIERDGQTIGKGTFLMHGVSRDIEVPFSVTRDGDRVVLDGEANIIYTDWELKVIRMVIFTVKPELKPHFHLVGKLKEEQ